MMDEKQIKAVILDNSQGRALWHLGALLTFKALGAETHGQFWALEGLADKHIWLCRCIRTAAKTNSGLCLKEKSALSSGMKAG